ASSVNLKELQSLLHRRITDPERTNETLGVEPLPGSGVFEALVYGDERLSASERIGIYADAYFYRLLDYIAEDFPAPYGAITLLRRSLPGGFSQRSSVCRTLAIRRRLGEVGEGSSRCLPCH